MSVPVLHPEARVTLHKLVRRTTVNGSIPAAERYAQADRTLDLTPILSEYGSIHLSKHIRQPAGSFALIFSDAPQGSPLETIYGLIEPMDGIEIRLSHRHIPGRTPPIVMRGFVSAVRRSQTIGERGAPMRTVVVEGHDYGKVWAMLRVLRRPWFALGTTWLSSFPLFERFGIGMETTLPASDFIRQLVERILNPHLDGMLPSDWPMPRAFTVETLVEHGRTSVTGPQNAEGTVYQIAAEFTDVTAGFNELYVEDRPDNVTVVFRPNPAIDLDGSPIQPLPGGTRPVMPNIPGADILALELARSDTDVANYFWVEDPRFELIRSFPLQYQAATSAQRETVFMERHPNNLPSIYGLRPMVTATQMGESDNFQSGQRETAEVGREQANIRWLDDRRIVLGRTNRDNALLETGTARIAGNENIRPGQHVVLGSGDLAAPYYVASVTHDYIPFRGFFTTLGLERGQGFAKRIQLGRTSPYLAELAGAPQPAPGSIPPTGHQDGDRRTIGQTGEAGTPDGGAGPAAATGARPSTERE